MSARTFVTEFDLARSPAYFALTGKAPQVLAVFRTKCRMMKTGHGGNKRWVIANNGELTFTYREAKKNYGMHTAVFQRAIDQLLKCGFIDIATRGCIGQSTKYAISERWRNFGTPDFQEHKRYRMKRGRGREETAL
jgi:hypothetical protein